MKEPLKIILTHGVVTGRRGYLILHSHKDTNCLLGAYLDSSCLKLHFSYVF